MTQANGQETQLAQVTRMGMESQERNNEIATASIAGAAKAKIEAGFVLAFKYPRDEETARSQILNICKNPEFADKAIYSKPVGNKSVEGPSIRFIETALRLWKHVAALQIPILDDAEKLVFNQEVYDLQANVCFSECITIRKTVERKKADGRQVLGQRRNTNNEIVYIVVATEDEINVKKSALASKSIRNSGGRVIPEHIIAEAMRVCEQALIDKVNKDPEAAKRQIFDAFSALQIMPKDLEEFLQHPLKQVSAEEIAQLRKIYLSIKDGEAKWSDFVTPAPAQSGAGAAVSFNKGKPTPEPQKTEADPKAAVIEVKATVVEQASATPEQPANVEAAEALKPPSAAEKNLLSVCDSIRKELGDAAGNEMITNCLGAEGYEKLADVSDDGKRRVFMSSLLATLDRIKSKK